MKLPTIIQATNEHIAAGQAVAIQIVTTAESILDRRLGNLTPEERAHLEIDLSPREYVIDYLERAFPTQQMQVFTDDTGNARSQPMFDDDGHPVHNSEAIEAKQNLIEHLCAMPPIKSALDALIEHYGADRIAEVTGRTKRLITMSDGTQKLESRSARTNQAETAHFMNGDKNIDLIQGFVSGEDRIELDDAIFSAAGSPGSLAGSAFAMNTTGQAIDADDRIIFNTTNGHLTYEVDGSDTTYSAIHFTTLAGVSDISATDVYMV